MYILSRNRYTTSESKQKHLFMEQAAARKRVTPLHIACALFSGTAALGLQAVLVIAGFRLQNCAGIFDLRFL